MRPVGRLVVALVDVESPIRHVWADEVGEIPVEGSIYELPEEAGSMAGSWLVLSHEEAEPAWKRGRRGVRLNAIRVERYVKR